jgi:regulator of replication initiation timing
MDTKAFMENIRREINSAMSKAFDKVEELSKLSRLKLKIGTFKGEIKDIKSQIGDYIYEHKADFNDNEFLAEQVKKIEEIEHQITGLEAEISILKEKGEDEEATDEV